MDYRDVHGSDILHGSQGYQGKVDYVPLLKQGLHGSQGCTWITGMYMDQTYYTDHRDVHESQGLHGSQGYQGKVDYVPTPGTRITWIRGIYMDHRYYMDHRDTKVLLHLIYGITSLQSLLTRILEYKSIVSTSRETTV